MKSASIRSWISDYYSEGWSAALVVLDAVVFAIIILDWFRFTSENFEIGALYGAMWENPPTNWVEWRVVFVWIVAIPWGIAACRTSWRKAHEQSRGVQEIPGPWRMRVNRIFRLRHPVMIVAHVCFAVLIAHFAVVGVQMQRFSGRSESVGWGFQSYWASIVGFSSIFYATILVPAFQIAVVKMLGIRFGGGHGLGTETGIEASITKSHAHLH